MTILANASNFVLHNSYLVEHNVHEGGGLKILHNASLPDATHDSALRESILYSIPKTRHEDFVDKFIAWARQVDTLPSVMCLNGPKSTLAQMCAEKLGEQLAATFFFSRSHKIDDPRRFFTTLASQFATHFPPYAALLDARLRRNPTLVSKSLKVQCQQLIAAPLQELLAQGVDLGPKRVVIVEGIEECEDVEARWEIVRIILESARAPVFRWAIFSKRDCQLEPRLAKWGLTNELCWMVDHSGLGDADPDRKVYIRVELIQNQRIIAVWLNLTCGTKIVASTAFFFFKLMAIQSGS